MIYQVSDDTRGRSSDAAVAEPFASCQALDNTCRIVDATIPAAVASHIKHEVIDSPEQEKMDIYYGHLRACPHWKCVWQIFALRFITLLKVQLHILNFVDTVFFITDHNHTFLLMTVQQANLAQARCDSTALTCSLSSIQCCSGLVMQGSA